MTKQTTIVVIGALRVKEQRNTVIGALRVKEQRNKLVISWFRHVVFRVDTKSTAKD